MVQIQILSSSHVGRFSVGLSFNAEIFVRVVLGVQEWYAAFCAGGIHGKLYV